MSKDAYKILLEKYNQLKEEHEFCKILNGEFAEDYCPEHKPRGKTMDYKTHLEWMDRQEKRGYKQYKCSKCGHWLYRCEL